jgi:uncharacterized protein (TIRG00374 family)
MAWIFQTIFWGEGKQAWQRDGDKPAWQELTRAQRLQVSWTHGPSELWRNLTQIHALPMLASFGCFGLTIGIGMLRWRLVLRVHGLNLPLSRVAEISLVAHFFNSFLLGSSGGDLMKAYYAARETHHKKTEAVTTVAVDRLIGLFAMLFFGATLMLVNLGFVLGNQTLKACGGLVLLMLAGCTGVLFMAFWGGVSRRVPSARNWLRRLPKGATVEKGLDACRVFGQHPGMLLQSLGLSMLLNVMCVLQVLLLARGLGMTATTAQLFTLVPVVFCISALPITPNGLGVRENLFVMILASMGNEHTVALSLSLLAYAGSLCWSLVGGVVYLLFRQKHHLTEVASRRQPED